MNQEKKKLFGTSETTSEMLINKKYCIETWFSPKKCQIQGKSDNQLKYSYVNRKIGPTQVYFDTALYWRNKNYQLHRIDGPCFIYFTDKHWCLLGINLREERYWNE